MTEYYNDDKAITRLMNLRQKLFQAIERELASDGHCKSYDGTFEIGFPGYFDNDTNYRVTLHCYIIGPGRHHHWHGTTLEEAITKAETDINEWIEEP